MLFLVDGIVERSEYMGKTKKESVLRLVEAESSTEASDKYHDYFRTQTSEYSVYVTAQVKDVSSVIM